jgi:hypothetical protein
MKKTFLKVVALISLSIIALAGCPADSVSDSGLHTFESASLQAKPIPASNKGTPTVLDSYTDGNNNFYLIDVGYILDMYILTIAAVDYTGVPMDFTKTITTTETYTNSLTETVSKSIAVSRTNGAKVSIAAEYNAKAKVMGIIDVGYSVKAGLEASWSVQKSWTNSKSTSNTITTAKQYAESQTIGYHFGANDHSIGKYRYAIYGVCDVYFILKTSSNNKTLLGWETVVCARPDDYFLRSEYTADRDFNTVPVGTIDFEEDFYKNLPLPSSGNGGRETGDTGNSSPKPRSPRSG